MTGRTHDLAAFTALSYIVLSQPLQNYSLGTILVAFSTNMIGGLAPDLDQSTTEFWKIFRGGRYIGDIIAPLIAHRHISHSIIGIILGGVIISFALNVAKSFLLVDMSAVWWAFMIGYLSHIVMDMFTTEGVPLLFPLKFKFGFPPLRSLRIPTNGIVERGIVFPGLLLLNGYLYYQNYHRILDFFKNNLH